MNTLTRLEVGVLGTGLSALVAAHFVKKSGHTAVVLDTGRGYVRLGRTFSYGGARFDQFQRTIAERDTEVHSLISELGIEALLQWHSETGRRFLWPFGGKPKIATCPGLSAAIEAELENRVEVEPVCKAVDLAEFDHRIEVRTECGRREFDALITTLPVDEVEDMARGLIAQDMPHSQSLHQTLVNVVFICATPLFKKHSTFVGKRFLPFHEVFSTTDVVSKLTAINVCGYSDASEAELKILALRFLCENFSEFQPSNVLALRVFQASERIPVEALSDDDEPIPARVGEGRLFLASRELGYGLPMSMNTDLVLAREAVESFLECAPIFACGGRQVARAAGR